MIRLASSASSARTEILTSPSPSIASGNTECGIADVTIDMTPWVSSSPRTMLASTSDCVRKWPTRSGKWVVDRRLAIVEPRRGGGDVFDLQQDHRHIVVLRRVADKRRDFAQHALPELLGRQVRMLLHEPREAVLTKQIVCAVHRFGDAVREKEVQVALGERDRVLFEQLLEHLAIVELQAEH